MASEESIKQFITLVDLMAKLRGPGGCPWDKKQTHATLKPYLLEEAYEVMETLDEGNTMKLCQELGDLQLQIIFHAQIASENGDFEMADVLKGINEKLIHRHPHIFGSTKVNSADEVAHNWEELKQEERGDVSMLVGVPEQMPALGYSQAIQRRVAQVGFDWADIGGVIEKLAEEVAEFQNAENQERKEQEFGDLLFTLANIARRMDIDLESSLRQANARFVQRFSYMEAACRKQGKNIGDLTFAEQNALWDEAKKIF